jgi:hypothetical protein
MVRQIKLSMWDALSHYVTGFVVMLSVYLHGAAKGLVPSFEGTESKVALIGFVGVLLPYVVGLLFEPVANLVSDKLKKGLPSRLGKTFGWPDISADVEQTRLSALAKEVMPKGVKDNIDIFQWCKDYLVQNGTDTPYMVFLAKFGFYRNMGCLFFMNALAVGILYWQCWCWTVCGIAVSCVVLGIIYYNRSGKFYRHLSVAMYRNYLVAMTYGCKKAGKSKDKDSPEGEDDD